MVPEEIIMTDDKLHESLIKQLYMKSTLWARLDPARAYKFKTLESIVLMYGRGLYCTANRWTGIRRGPLGNCYQNATHLVMSDPDRFIYVEGYFISPCMSLVVGEHAWVLDRRNDNGDCRVIDPAWRDTKDAAYLGIPFSFDYMMSQLREHHIYGLLDAYWARWPIRQLPAEKWLYSGTVNSHFEVPDDLETWCAENQSDEGRRS
jgi:hypothetical protein